MTCTNSTGIGLPNSLAALILWGRLRSLQPLWRQVCEAQQGNSASSARGATGILKRIKHAKLLMTLQFSQRACWAPVQERGAPWDCGGLTHRLAVLSPETSPPATASRPGLTPAQGTPASAFRHTAAQACDAGSPLR